MSFGRKSEDSQRKPLYVVIKVNEGQFVKNCPNYTFKSRFSISKFDGFFFDLRQVHPFRRPLFIKNIF